MVKSLIFLCALSVPQGWHHCILTSHYRHLYPQDGAITWSSTTGVWVEGPTSVYANSEGSPMGHQWVMDMVLAGECGTLPEPNKIFFDGFESGTVHWWSQSVGALTKTESVEQ